MSPTRLLRWGGLAAILATLAGIANDYLETANPWGYGPTDFNLPYEATFGIPFALLLITLLAIRQLHLPPNRSWGRFGTIAFGITFVAYLLITIKTLLIVLAFGLGAFIDCCIDV